MIPPHRLAVRGRSGRDGKYRVSPSRYVALGCGLLSTQARSRRSALRVPSMPAINAVGKLFQVQWSPGAPAPRIGPLNTLRIGIADEY